MALLLEKNAELIRQRHELLRRLDKPNIEEDVVALVRELKIVDESIMVNLESHLRLLLQNHKETNNNTMSDTRKYQQLMRIGREAQAIVVQVREEKKYMRRKRR